MHLTVAYKTMLSAMLPEMSLASKRALYDARCTLTLSTSKPTDVPARCTSCTSVERRYGGHRTLRVCTFFLSMPFGLQDFRWTILLALGVSVAIEYPTAPYTVPDHCEYCSTVSSDCDAFSRARRAMPCVTSISSSQH
jgi:hypothetical protein